MRWLVRWWKCFSCTLKTSLCAGHHQLSQELKHPWVRYLKVIAFAFYGHVCFVVIVVVVVLVAVSGVHTPSHRPRGEGGR